MSDTSNGGGRAKGSHPETGVLANLPRTRPQRASARRSAARKAARATAKTGATPGAKPAKAKTKAKSAKVKRTGSTTIREESVPRQGFEVDGEIASGSVQPPGAAELVSSAAELAGELAKAGVTGGARLLKDLFARLPPG